MRIFELFKRTKPTTKVEAKVEHPVIAKNDTGKEKAWATYSGDPEKIQAMRDGLNLVKERRGMKTQLEVMLFLLERFKAHEERALADRGIPTIKSARDGWDVVAAAAGALPPLPKVSLSSQGEIDRRIKTCRAVLKSFDEGMNPVALRGDWLYSLRANERLLALVTSGLHLEDRKTAGVLVEGLLYYRAGPGKAKYAGEAKYRPMEVNAFLAMATERSMARDIAAGQA